MGSLPDWELEYTDDREDSEPYLAARRRRRKTPARMIKRAAVNVPTAIPPMAEEDKWLEEEVVVVGVGVDASTLSKIAIQALTCC